MKLRRVRPADAGLVYRWICDPEVRAAAFSSEPISPEVHEAWFARKAADAAALYWIAEDEAGAAVGQARIEDGAISIVVGAEHRGKGLGPAILKLAAEKYAAPLRAFVRADNPRSAKAFERAGFERAGNESIKGVPALRYELKRA